MVELITPEGRLERKETLHTGERPAWPSSTTTSSFDLMFSSIFSRPLAPPPRRLAVGRILTHPWSGGAIADILWRLQAVICKGSPTRARVSQQADRG